jgi:hydrogenase-4 component B
VHPVALAAYILGLLAGGAVVASLLAPARRVCGWFTVLVAAAALVLALSLMVSVAEAGGPLTASAFTLGGLGATVTYYVDGLSSLLLVLVLLLGFLCAIYSVRYLEHGEGGAVGRFYAPFLLFLAGMCGVLCLSDWFFFLVAWEFMSLPAYLLIVYERERPEALRAGLKYFVMTHIGNLGLFIGVLILYRLASPEGSFNFVAVSSALGGLIGHQPWLAGLVLGLMTLGFMTKAGVFPMGDWLPDAHPAAPSPVSALLSGIMIKLGAYGVMRIFLWMLVGAHAPNSWFLGWGIALATMGTLSAFVGSAAAVKENDAKRLLAYSSIGQIGYIFLALGISVALVKINPTLSALAFLAGLLHIIADAFHKALLFLTTGSVLRQTGTRDLNELGGLLPHMPSTGFASVIGVLSLAGIPCTGAFVSKWLLLQSALFGGRESAIFVAYAVVALFASVLGLAYGLKLLAATYLGLPSRLVCEVEPREVPAAMRWPQGVLAALCILLGLFPSLALVLCVGAAPALLTDGALRALGGMTAVSVRTLAGAVPGGSFTPLWALALFVALFLVCRGLGRVGGVGGGGGGGAGAGAAGSRLGLRRGTGAGAAALQGAGLLLGLRRVLRQRLPKAESAACAGEQGDATGAERGPLAFRPHRAFLPEDRLGAERAAHRPAAGLYAGAGGGGRPGSAGTVADMAGRVGRGRGSHPLPCAPECASPP